VEYVKGNVAVNGGKWYLEMKVIASGSLNFGWATNNYNPKVETCKTTN
jgi:hypothetical protein